MTNKDPFAEHRERDRKAAEMVSGAKFEPIEHPYPYLRPKKKAFSDDPPKPLKAYRVLVDGVLVCEVHEGLEAVHRKSGRIITSTRHVRRWSYSPKVPCAPEHVYWHNTRCAAVVSMLERFLLAGGEIRKGKVTKRRGHKEPE